jgi:hypothetical protein
MGQNWSETGGDSVLIERTRRVAERANPARGQSSLQRGVMRDVVKQFLPPAKDDCETRSKLSAISSRPAIGFPLRLTADSSHPMTGK